MLLVGNGPFRDVGLREQRAHGGTVHGGQGLEGTAQTAGAPRRAQWLWPTLGVDCDDGVDGAVRGTRQTLQEGKGQRAAQRGIDRHHHDMVGLDIGHRGGDACDGALERHRLLGEMNAANRRARRPGNDHRRLGGKLLEQEVEGGSPPDRQRGLVRAAETKSASAGQDDRRPSGEVGSHAAHRSERPVVEGVSVVRGVASKEQRRRCARRREAS